MLAFLSQDETHVVLTLGGLRAAAASSGMENLSKAQIISALTGIAEFHPRAPSEHGIKGRPPGFVVPAEMVGLCEEPESMTEDNDKVASKKKHEDKSNVRPIGSGKRGMVTDPAVGNIPDEGF